MRLPFFDVDVGVGRSGMGLPVSESPADLLARMARYGIQDALVHDRAQHESGDFRAHDFILKFCAGQVGLHPVIPVVPPATGEQMPPVELVGYCRAQGIKAVRVSPKAHRFVCEPASMGILLAELERHRMLLIYNSMALVDHPWEHAPDWRSIRETALAFPELPILVVFTGMLQGRHLYPLLAQCPNVRVDLTCASFQFIEDVAERFGEERLFMASHFPVEDPGLYTTPLLYAGVGEGARRAIAGDNVRRLLEGVR